LLRNIVEGEFAGEEALQGLLKRHDDLFRGIKLQFVKPKIGAPFYVETSTNRTLLDTNSRISQYEARRQEALDKIVKEANVGRFDNEVGVNGSSVFNQFLHKVLDWHNKDFPFYLMQKAENVSQHGGENSTGLFVFHSTPLNDTVVGCTDVKNFNYLRRTNPELANYLNLMLDKSYVGNSIMHDGEICIVSPMHCHHNSQVTGIYFTPQKLIE
jgi:hypothetical protein